MKQTVKVKKRISPPFLLSLGMCGGKPILLNVNYIEYVERDGDTYVFTMKSGKVFSVAKSTALDEWLKPFIIGHEMK